MDCELDLSHYTLETLHQEGEFVLCRGRSPISATTVPASVLVVMSTSEHPGPDPVRMLEHEYSLRAELDPAWAARPLTLAQHHGHTALVLEDKPAEPLNRLLETAPNGRFPGTPRPSGLAADVGLFLRLAVGMATALGQAHRRGVIHKDIKPSHLLVNTVTGQVWLTGFGIASRLQRERQSPEPPETIAGTLAYMAPEQTGRMNRSIDARSDLYALGVTLYQMLTGSLPFAAADAMEWVHCHIARQPTAPSKRVRDVPPPVSAIIMKLLTKTAEERYQTAAGLERDLRHCLAQWNAEGRLANFPLGEHDTPDRLLIPEKLYGRSRERAALLAAFERMVKDGMPELVLVSGYSGIGKSSVVNELQPVLVPPRGLFASGKFDQYKRDIPYSTLAQAFQSLIRQLLTKSETELGKWRDDLCDALNQNGQLIVDLVPELKLVIGDQPPVPEVSAQDAQRRFQVVIRRFIAVFARQEHPLALFLDDLQWLDAATLDLLEDLLTRSDLQHLMLIGAYRDNEVDATHPLMRKLEAIRSAGGKIQEITLAPLAQEHLKQLLADALRCKPEHSAPLAQLVQAKTGGNPFFTIHFISSLAEEKMLAFDHDVACWSWDLDRIHAKGYTDNVADLMITKLIRLPSRTQEALQQLACLGNVAPIPTLSLVLEISQEQTHAALWESVRQGLVEQMDGSYKFIHDRVHEAAYSLIPEASRAEAHLRIGRLLAEHISPEKREEAVFDIVNQLNRGVTLIASPEERENLAELNLIAGKRAKASTAYVSALKYLIAGAALLGDDRWERYHDLIFALELARAECESLSGALETADERLIALSKRAADTVERSAVAFLHMGVCTELAQSDRAVAVALDYLRHVGIDWSPHPTKDEVRREYEQIRSHLGIRSIEEVVALPLMSDPESLATVDVLTRLVPAALYTDPNLDALTICKAVNLSLQRGNCDASCLAYAMLSRIAINRFGDYKTAFRFGQVGIELVEGRGLKRFQAGTYLFFANWIAHWMKHVRASIDLQRRALEAASRIGDLTYATYAHCALNASLLVAGDPLSDVQREAELGVAFAQKAGFGSHADYIGSQLAMIRMLRGLTSKFGCFDSEQFEELRYEHIVADNPSLHLQGCFYWVRKVQARYSAGEYKDALEASSQAQRWLWASTAFLEEAEYHFYSALSRAASYDSLTAVERVQHIEALAEHQRHLEIWAANCPENFENRAALVGAEIARIENRDLDAMRLYEKAIQSSRTSGFVNHEALAYERASAFYRARGFDQFADAYLRNARACYATWGADGKVRQLDRLYPGLKQDQPSPGPASTITARVEGLDLATVIQVSQAVSSEIVLEKLFDTVMRKAMEHAGAERGLLIVPRGHELRIEAESRTSGNDVIVSLGDASAAATGIPESILRYVIRTHDSVILDDASSANPFSADPYFLQNRARSILCLPLLNHAKISGVLYLENNLTPRVFTSGRITVLRVLVSQAAISLENTRLYRDLEDREAKIRRLVDANIIGIFIWDFDGQILDANDAFLTLVGYDRTDLAAGRLRWTDITPAEWREHDQKIMEEHKKTGVALPFEKEYARKDGTRVPVLVGAATFQDSGSQGVAFVLDLTERKRAEERLRDVFDAIPALAWCNLPDGSNEFLNRNWHEYTGLSPEESHGWGWQAAFHQEDLPPLMDKWRKMLISGEPDEVEARIRRHDGVYRWFLIRAEPLRDENGEIVRWYGTSTDIEDRKKAEEALQASERNLTLIINTIPTYIQVLRSDGSVLYRNQAVLDYFGITLEDAQNEDHRARYFHPEDVERLREERRVALTRPVPFEHEQRLMGKDGRYHWFLIRYSPLLDEQGRIERWYVAAFDTEDRKRAEESLRQAQAELAHVTRLTTLGGLTASIAHEVNQPLSGIVSNASACLRWLAGDMPNLEEARQSAQRIVRDGKRAGEVIVRVRALATKKASAQREKLDLNGTIQEVLALVADEAKKKNVIIRTEFADDLVPVSGDRVQLQQVTLNLVMNAIEAMSNNEGGRARDLVVTTRNIDTSQVLITVEDSGPGIAPEMMGRIFDSFYTTKPGGMGLGLSISRSILQAHGGRLWATVKDGPGAVFHVTLPKYHEEKPDAGAKAV